MKSILKILKTTTVYKTEIEEFLEWYDKLKDLKYASLRYFNAAGYDINGKVRGLETNPANLLPVIMEAACGKRDLLRVFGNDYPTADGTCIRDYIHVTDLAEGHLRAMEYIIEKKESIKVNLGSEKGISVNEMLEAARKITGRKLKLKSQEEELEILLSLLQSQTLQKSFWGGKLNTPMLRP